MALNRVLDAAIHSALAAHGWRYRCLVYMNPPSSLDMLWLSMAVYRELSVVVDHVLL